jgi:hypothetical protein
MVPVLAFSLQDQVEKYGAYVGIAAFIGLAVLTLLYFAQARELKRLRDWAGRAPERAQELEARVVAQAEEARRVPEPAAAAEPAPGVEQPVAAASGNGRQAGAPAPIPMGPRPAVAMAAAAAAGGAEAPERPVTDGDRAAAPDQPAEAAGQGVVPAEGAAAGQPAEAAEPAAPGQPAGAAGQSAEPATDGERVGPSQPAEGAGETAVPAEAAGQGGAPEGADQAADRQATPPQETEDAPALAPGNGAATEPPPIPRATPRPQLPRREGAAAPLRSATSRSATLPPRRTAAPGRRPTGADRPDSSAGRMALFAILAVVVIGAGAFGAMQLLGDDPGEERAQEPNVTIDPQGTGGQGGGSERAVAARPETVVVVLNGTPAEGLAGEKQESLIAEGYSADEGMIRTANNTDQQRQDSAVFYADGQRRMARDVAAVLGIEGTPDASDPETQALADSTDVTGTLPAEVTVVLGADQAP